jgi:hypothetical protein
VLGASAVLALGAGVAFGASLVAGHDADSLNKKREEQGLTSEELADYNAAIDRRAQRLTWTWGLLAASGAVALTGTLLYVMDNPRPEAVESEHGLAITPGVAPDWVGLAVGGRF